MIFSFQMTCLRLLELVPIVFEKVSLSVHKQSVRDSCSVDWLHDLVDWGKSSIFVVVIYWKKSVVSLMRLLKGSYDGNSAKIIGSIETLMLGGECLHFNLLLCILVSYSF